MRQVRSFFALAATTVAFVSLGACAPGQPGNGNHGDDDGDDDSSGTPDAGDPNAGFIDAAPFLDGGPFVDGGSNGGACDKIDILFVVDNSASMEDEQNALAAAFPQFASVIENYTNHTGQHLDYHIAITTTDITYSQDVPIFGPQVSQWNDGKFVTGNCQGWPAGRLFLQKGDSNVSSAFSCAAQVGIDGSGLEMPLEAAKEALMDRVPTPNAGFLRQDALLAIVMLTDENDCSVPNLALGAFDTPCTNNLEPIQNYVAKFDTLKGGHGRWATAVIAIPPGAGQCGGSQSSENVRLKSFTDMAGTNGVFANICSGNMAQSLMQAFDTFGLACENIPPVN
jgi:hypothetical protein